MARLLAVRMVEPGVRALRAVLNPIPSFLIKPIGPFGSVVRHFEPVRPTGTEQFSYLLKGEVLPKSQTGRTVRYSGHSRACGGGALLDTSFSARLGVFTCAVQVLD